jgi:sugar-specific transcriptional regulator TrmB
MDFKNLGLNYYEDKALNVIIREKTNIKKLSKTSNIPPGKIYSVIKSLQDKGLILVSDSRPKYVYVDNASKIIERLIKEKQSKDELNYNELLRESINISKNKIESNTLIDIGYTQEDNVRIQSRVFEEAEHEVCQLFNDNHRPSTNRKNKTLWEEQIIAATKRGIIFKCIYPENIELPASLKKLSSASHKSSSPNKSFNVRRKNIQNYRIDIVDNKNVLIKFTYEDPLIFGGVMYIKDTKLASNLRKIFDDIWMKAK